SVRATSRRTDRPSGSPAPPDPVQVAPPVDRGAATDFGGATAFLYTGDNPVQTGVAPGAIETRRAAVLRGKVETRDGQPLADVVVTGLGHPELGQTRSRSDAPFARAVKGGGSLTIGYARAGSLAVQRQVDPPTRDYAWLPDVALIPRDAQVTAIDLSGGAPVQAARGSAVADADGARQATVLFPSGTQATMTLPDGST